MDDDLRISRYRVSPASDQLIHQDSSNAERLRREIVLRVRTATTEALNAEIERVRLLKPTGSMPGSSRRSLKLCTMTSRLSFFRECCWTTVIVCISWKSMNIMS